MLLVRDDLHRVLYRETVHEISRANPNIVTTILRDAESEAKSYLGRFDLVALFGIDPPPDDLEAGVPPTVNSPMLKSKVVDIAAWMLIKLCNVNVNYDTARASYEDAIRFFEKVTMGKVTPDNWPLKPRDDERGTNPGAVIIKRTNPERRNHF